MRVLILEDNQDINNLIKVNIQSINSAASNTIIDQAYEYDNACLFLSLGYRYDLLVVDIHLVDKNKSGALFAKKFKTFFPDASVFIITGSSSIPADLPYDSIFRKDDPQNFKSIVYSIEALIKDVNILEKNGNVYHSCDYDTINAIENRVIRLEEKTEGLEKGLIDFKKDMKDTQKVLFTKIEDVQKEVKEAMSGKIRDLIVVLVTVISVGGLTVKINYSLNKSIVQDQIELLMNRELLRQKSENTTMQNLRFTERNDSSKTTSN